MSLEIKLHQTLERFCEIFPRKYDFGNISIKKQNYIKDADFEILNEAKEYFSLVNIEPKSMIGGDISVTLCPFDKMKDFLLGWRWIEENSILIETLDWERTWIPLGNRNGGIIFVKSELSKNNVFASFTGGFEPILISDNICSFFHVLALWMEVEMNDFMYETLDESFAPKEEYLQRVEAITSNCLSEQSRQGFSEFFFG